MDQKPETAAEIIRSLPQRFKPEAADDGYNGVFHIDISGERGGQWTLKVEDQACSLEEGLHGEANCVVKAEDKVYEDLELGRINAQMAVLMGKVKISNLAEMMRFVNLFERLH